MTFISDRDLQLQYKLQGFEKILKEQKENLKQSNKRNNKIVLRVH